MTGAIAAAYDHSSEGWRLGPEGVYARLAEALVSLSPTPLSGARVLDLGAGTGTAGRAARARGAVEVVATDVAVGMLRHARPELRAVGADGALLPFRDGSFDLVVAAFSLSHVTAPDHAVAECRRVGRSLLASAFAPGWSHPAKAAVDAVMADFGFVLPDWYLRMKREVEPGVDNPGSLAALARGAGFEEVSVQVVEVDSGLRKPADVVDWRLGMAHLAPFVASLPGSTLAEARAAAEAAVAGTGPVLVPMLGLSARGATG